MSVLEQVTELKNQGVPENEIINSLKEQGVSPKVINDALNQSRIKKAVSSENNGNNSEEMEPSIMGPEKAEGLPTEGNISDEDLTPPIPSAYNTMMVRSGPVTKEISDEYVPQSASQQPNQYDYSQYQPQQYYQESYDYPPSYGTQESVSDTDTLIEISEQVFSEKIKPLQKQIDEFNEFKTLMQTKFDNVSERLKRLESGIDRLQSAILEKVGDYGRGLDSVKKEMEMMQNSFGKVVNNLADNSEHKRTHSGTTPSHTIHKTTTVVHHSKPKNKSRKKIRKK